MTEDYYLSRIIDKYTPKNLSEYQYDIIKLHSILKEWAASCYVDLKTSGSIAKGTAISLSSDVDYLVSLTSDCNGTLKAIFNSLGKCLSNHYKIRRQNVSFGINLNGLKVDVAVAQKRHGNTNFHSIYVSKTDSWKQTNIQRHINDVSNSGRLDEIRLAKIWRELNELEFPSIYMEYLLIEILKYKPKNNLARNFHYTLSELAKNQQNNPLFSRLKDPANSNNVLSELMTANEKNSIIFAARNSINKTYCKIVY